MKKPLVSVVMPVYNVEDYVRESIYSILSQTYTNFEFIIINDGSTDNTPDIVRNVQDDRILFVDYQENKGNYPRRNEGIRLAKGEYVCVMDGDDIAMPDRIKRQVEVMENDSSLLALGTAFVFSNGYICRKPSDYEVLKIMLLFNSVFLHPSLIIRRDVLEYVDYYNEKYCYASDYDLVCKIANAGKIVNIPDILMKYRVHEKQISSAHRMEQEEYANKIRLDYLKKCGFSLSTKDMETITLIMANPDKINNLNVDIFPVINSLRRQNQKLKYFDSDIFNIFWGI